MAEDAKKPMPEDIKQTLITLSKSSKTDIKTILKEFKEIMENDSTIQGMENKEHQARFACALLLNRYTSTGGAKQLYLKPLSIPRARYTKTNKWVGDIYSLVKIVEKDDDGNLISGELQLGAGTIWEKAAEAMQKLSSDKVYKTSLKVNEVKHGIELGGNDATFVEVEDDSFPTNEEFFNNEIKPNLNKYLVKLGEMELTNREDACDIRVIKAMVIDAGTGETANNVEYGRYTVTDDSMIGREEGGPANYSIWVHPSEVIWDTGSTLYFVGTIQYDEKAEIVRFNCHFIVPSEVALKREVKPKSVGDKEEVDVDSLDAELDEEHKKVEETLDEDEFSL